MPSEMEKTRAAIRAANLADFDANLMRGMTGKWENGHLVASDQSGWIWVRIGATTQDDMRVATRVLNAKVDSRPNIPVLVWKVGRNYEVYSIDTAAAAEKFGGALGNMALPRQAGDLVTNWIPGRQLKPGRCYLRTGALQANVMEITAGEFNYIDTAGNRRRWAAYPETPALDISSHVPGAGLERFVQIALNTLASAPTLVALLGTAVAQGLLTAADFAAIAIPANHLVLDAVLLRNGDTATQIADEERWYFARQFLLRGDYLTASGTATLTNKTIDGDDNTLQDISPASFKGAPAVVQGDLLYGLAAATLARLAKDTNATRYLSNTGGSNNPAWAQINLANGVTGLLKALNACDTITTTSSGNVDNFAIGDAPVVYVRFNNATAATLRGIAGSGTNGQICIVDSVGAANVSIAHQNAGSTAANRLINYVTGIDTLLFSNLGRAIFVYDATAQRWKMVSHNQGAAVAYTPTWTSTGTNPTPGNSTLTGSYLINGNVIMGDFAFTYGSAGVNPGTGVWLFGLPCAVSLQGGGGSANDAGVAGYNITAARNSSTTVSLSAAGAQVNGNNPFTWGSTDNIRLAWFGVAS